MGKEYNLDEAIAETIANFTEEDCFLVVSKLSQSSVPGRARFYTGEAAKVEFETARDWVKNGLLDWVGVWVVPADKIDGVAEQYKAGKTVPVEGLISFYSRPSKVVKSAGKRHKTDPYFAFNRQFLPEYVILRTGALVAVRKRIDGQKWEFIRVLAEAVLSYTENLVSHFKERGVEVEVLGVPAEYAEKFRGLIEDGFIERARDMASGEGVE